MPTTTTRRTRSLAPSLNSVAPLGLGLKAERSSTTAASDHAERRRSDRRRTSTRNRTAVDYTQHDDNDDDDDDRDDKEGSSNPSTAQARLADDKDVKRDATLQRDAEAMSRAFATFVPWPRHPELEAAGFNPFDLDSVLALAVMSANRSGVDTLRHLGPFAREDLEGNRQRTVENWTGRRSERGYGIDSVRICTKAENNFGGDYDVGAPFLFITEPILWSNRSDYDNNHAVFVRLPLTSADPSAAAAGRAETWHARGIYGIFWAGAPKAGEYRALSREKQEHVVRLISSYAPTPSKLSSSFTRVLFEDCRIEIPHSGQTKPFEEGTKAEQRARIERALEENSGLKFHIGLMQYAGLNKIEIERAVAKRDENRKRTKRRRMDAESVEL
ncbi:hypothetical protein JCM11491_001424 [Sporobolomyces phaffii]